MTNVAPPPSLPRPRPRSGARWRRPAWVGAALLLLTIGAAACSSGSSKSDSSSGTTALASGPAAAPTTAAASGSATQDHAASGAATSAGSGPTVGEAVAPPAPQILTTAEVTLKVPRANLVPTFDRISALATEHAGFVANANGGPAIGVNPQDTLELRIPADQVATVLGQLSALGQVTHTQTQSQDVSGQVSDLGTQIANLNAEETALRAIAAKSASVTDLLSVQQQLFDVRGQIQQLTEQQSSLTGQVAYATITVTLTVPPLPPAPKAPKPHRPGVWTQAVNLAGDHSLAVLRAVVIVTGWAFPGLVGLAVVAAVAAVVRRWRRQGASGPDAANPAG